MRRVIWKNAAARDRLDSWYARFADRIAGRVESREVPTRYGSSHVLLAGTEGAPTLVCLHAMRTGAAHLLSELGPLLGQFRIIAPDLPAQSVRGPQIRLPLNDRSHSDWLGDIFDGLAVQRAHLLGVSWGGFVARQFATEAPSRVESLTVLVPAGIVNGSTWRGVMAMAWPMVRYKLAPNDANVKRLLAPLVTTWEEHWVRFIVDSMEDMIFDMRIPPLATDDELRKLTMPSLVLAGDEDISFPGIPLVERVRTLMPSVDAEVLGSCKHCPPTNEAFRQWLTKRVSTHISRALRVSEVNAR